MYSLTRKLIVPMFLSALLLSGCGLLLTGGVVPGDPGALSTAAAQTVVAQLTQIAAWSTPTPTVMPPSPTPLPPTPTPQATQTPDPTSTPLPLPTATTPPLPCDWGQFIQDVTVPDGTVYAPGVKFTKTWRLRNIGSCAWTTDYHLVFYGGDAMNGPASLSLPGTVRPGETVDISVNLIAPSLKGEHRGEWKLRNAAGRLFGLGSDTDQPFWVKIKVDAPLQVVYDFTKSFCDAEWRSGTGNLPCPGSVRDEKGFVSRMNDPNLEYAVENEAGLFTHPQWVTDGSISGTYPAFKVQVGDRFKVVTACVAGSPSCDVMFQLNYQVAGGPLKNLKTWTEVYDGNPTRIDIDLSELDGQSVEFVLTVLTNGSSVEDWAFWLNPRIIR